MAGSSPVGSTIADARSIADDATPPGRRPNQRILEALLKRITLDRHDFAGGWEVFERFIEHRYTPEDRSVWYLMTTANGHQAVALRQRLKDLEIPVSIEVINTYLAKLGAVDRARAEEEFKREFPRGAITPTGRVDPVPYTDRIKLAQTFTDAERVLEEFLSLGGKPDAIMAMVFLGRCPDYDTAFERYRQDVLQAPLLGIQGADKVLEKSTRRREREGLFAFYEKVGRPLVPGLFHLLINTSGSQKERLYWFKKRIATCGRPSAQDDSIKPIVQGALSVVQLLYASSTFETPALVMSTQYT